MSIHINNCIHRWLHIIYLKFHRPRILYNHFPESQSSPTQGGLKNVPPENVWLPWPDRYSIFPHKGFEPCQSLSIKHQMYTVPTAPCQQREEM